MPPDAPIEQATPAAGRPPQPPCRPRLAARDLRERHGRPRDRSSSLEDDWAAHRGRGGRSSLWLTELGNRIQGYSRPSCDCPLHPPGKTEPWNPEELCAPPVAPGLKDSACR